MTLLCISNELQAAKGKALHCIISDEAKHLGISHNAMQWQGCLQTGEHTVGAGANHWLGPVGAAPAGGVAALRKFWLEVLPSLRKGVSCMANGPETQQELAAFLSVHTPLMMSAEDAKR